MKLLLTTLFFLTASAYADVYTFEDADPSIEQIEAFIQSWLKSPEANGFGGRNAWSVVEQNTAGEPLLPSPFGVWLFARAATDPFLDPLGLVGALDQALSRKFDRFFFFQVHISNKRFEVFYNARLLHPVDLLFELPSWYDLPTGVPLTLIHGIPLYAEIKVTEAWPAPWPPTPRCPWRVTAQNIQSGLFIPVPE